MPAAMDSNRYFLCPPDVYEAVRAGLDKAFGHPNGSAETCLPPLGEAAKSGERVLVPVLCSMAAWPEVAEQLTELGKAGHLKEISPDEYQTQQPQTPFEKS